MINIARRNNFSFYYSKIVFSPQTTGVLGTFYSTRLKQGDFLVEKNDSQPKNSLTTRNNAKNNLNQATYVRHIRNI